MLDLQTKQSKVRPTAGDIKPHPLPVRFCKALSAILAMLLLASSAWAFETDEDSQIGTSEEPKKFIVYNKVGINVPNPARELHVNGGGLFSGEVQAQKFIGVEGSWDTNGSNIFYTTKSVGIGTSSPTQRLEVNGTIKASLFEGEGIYWKKIPDRGNEGIYFDDTNVKRVGIGTNFPRDRLHVNGHVRADGDMKARSYLIESDRRLKENIKPIENVLPKLQQVDGVYFDWKQPKHDSQKGRQIGVIAQAVEAQFPELVTGGDGYKSVAYSNIVAVLIQAVKELKRDNDALAERIRVLEEK